jgi:hypothetical protein
MDETLNSLVEMETKRSLTIGEVKSVLNFLLGYFDVEPLE